MSLGYVTLLRNAMLNQIAAFVDAGAGAGKLRIYDGVQPATGGVATTLLAELAMSDPAFAAAAAAVLTANAIADDTSADAAGTGTWMRVVDSNNVVVYDGTVGTAAADLILNTVVFSIGLNVAVTALTITEGNP